MSKHSHTIRRDPGSKPVLATLPGLLALATSLFLLLPVNSAQAQRAAHKPSSAMDALASMTAYLGPRSNGRIISMYAEEGRPEPLYWEIVLLEPSAPRGRRVLRAGGGQVFYDRTPLGLPGSRGLTPILNISKFKLDSGRVFKIAERQAASNRIAFNHANYEVLASDPDSPPIWIVTLVDDRGDTVGKVDISAASGKILRSVWNPRKVRAEGPVQPPGPPGQQGQQPPPLQRQPDEGTGTVETIGRAIDRVKGVFR